MKKLNLFLLFLLLQPSLGFGQSEKVILITLDGLRWEELYTGADPWLIDEEKYTSGMDRVKKKYWADNPNERRELLMPFFWSTISKEGVLYGNRLSGSNVDLTNNRVFSYPGYNEILTGFADSTIDSNDKIPNKNVTVLEWVNQQESFAGKVAAFASWDVFPYIINEERSGIIVNSGFEDAKNEPNQKELWLNEIQSQTPSPWSSVRLDVFTHNYALEYLKKKRPDLLYISYGETDDFAHNGDYDQYLDSANRTDSFIRDLWHWTQSQNDYRDKTTFVITTDHGRGKKEDWTGHGSGTKGSNHIWIAMLGQGIDEGGEMKNATQLYQNQIASSVAHLLGLNYSNRVPVGASILD